MLSHCPSTSLRCSGVSHRPLGTGVRRNSRRLIVKAESNGAVSQQVQEARAWIEGWKFRQLKVSSLEEGIIKAAEYLEGTKPVRQAKKRAEEEMLKRTVKVTFSIKQPCKYGSSLKLVGSAPEMGSWTPASSPPMKWGEGDVWELALDMKAGSYEYKVVTYSDGGESEWEQGDNRIVKVPLAAEDGTSMSVELKALVEEKKPKEVAAKS